MKDCSCGSLLILFILCFVHRHEVITPETIVLLILNQMSSPTRSAESAVAAVGFTLVRGCKRARGCEVNADEEHPLVAGCKIAQDNSPSKLKKTKLLFVEK